MISNYNLICLLIMISQNIKIMSQPMKALFNHIQKDILRHFITMYIYNGLKIKVTWEKKMTLLKLLTSWLKWSRRNRPKWWRGNQRRSNGRRTKIKDSPRNSRSQESRENIKNLFLPNQKKKNLICLPILTYSISAIWEWEKLSKSKKQKIPRNSSLNRLILEKINQDKSAQVRDQSLVLKKCKKTPLSASSQIWNHGKWLDTSLKAWSCVLALMTANH